ncbi:MAG: hypothetical protein K5891_12015 [Lachnospiraceae bacterium]|nr:hypothetical protein [Lachnospiraceae bacterium]
MKKFFQWIVNTIQFLIGLGNGKPGNLLFTGAFFVVFFHRFYQSTMFSRVIQNDRPLTYLTYLAFIILCGLAGLKMLECFPKQWKMGILIAAALVIGFCSWRVSHLKDPFVLVCMVMAAKDRNIRPHFQISLVMGSVMMIACYLASMTGYIPYLT